MCLTTMFCVEVFMWCVEKNAQKTFIVFSQLNGQTNFETINMILKRK